MKIPNTTPVGPKTSEKNPNRILSSILSGGQPHGQVRYVSRNAAAVVGALSRIRGTTLSGASITTSRWMMDL